MCLTGAGRTTLPSLTRLCSGCLESPMTQASVPTWRERRSQGSGQIPAMPTQTASSVRKQSVRLWSTYSSFQLRLDSSAYFCVKEEEEEEVFFGNIAKLNKSKDLSQAKNPQTNI